MTRRYITIVLSLTAAAVACLYAGGAFAAAYKVTAGGQTETVCSASSAAWKLYAIATKQQLTDGRIERLADDSQESTACIAERQAKAAEANG